MASHTLVVIGVGLASALLLGIGFVLQQHGAAEEPDSERLTIRLLVVGAGDPHGGSPSGVAWSSWALSVGAVAAGAAVLVMGGRQLRPTAEPARLAAAAGVLFGLQDALTQRVERVASRGLVHLLTGWSLFLLVAVAVVGILLNQSAFEAGPLSRSLPAVVAGEPLTGIGIGVGLYGEHITLALPWVVVELVGLAVMVWGVCRVATSPVVTGAPLRESRPG